MFPTVSPIRQMDAVGSPGRTVPQNRWLEARNHLGLLLGEGQWQLGQKGEEEKEEEEQNYWRNIPKLFLKKTGVS